VVGYEVACFLQLSSGRAQSDCDLELIGFVEFGEGVGLSLLVLALAKRSVVAKEIRCVCSPGRQSNIEDRRGWPKGE